MSECAACENKDFFINPDCFSFSSALPLQSLSSSHQEQEWCHGTGCFGLLGLPPLVCFFELLSCGFMHPARDGNDEKTAGSGLVVVVGWKGEKWMGRCMRYIVVQQRCGVTGCRCRRWVGGQTSDFYQRTRRMSVGLLAS